MAGKSTHLSRAVLNLVFRTNTFVKPSTVYISLHDADPTDADLPDTELPIGVGGYARAAVPTGDSYWSAPTTSGAEEVITNVDDIDFGDATADLGLVTHYGIKDAATGGNLLYSGLLGVARTVSNGDPIQVPEGSITIREG